VSARDGTPRAAFLSVPAVWAAALLLLPAVLLVAMTTGSRPPHGGVAYDGTGGGWRWLVESREIVGRSLADSLRVAGLATLLAVGLATPLAWWIARLPRRARAGALLLAVVPSWTSLLLRAYAWRFLLGNEGPLEAAAAGAGLPPLRLLHTDAAVVLGLAFASLPFAVVPIHAAVERLDRDVLAAARDLGAGAFTAFLRVGFPLTRAGTVAAATLVFVPSLASFTVPALLGGADSFLLGPLAQERFLGARDWPSGAALAAALGAASLAAWLLVRRAR
jgi:spermidine/putrescine transport system permease protein